MGFCCLEQIVFQEGEPIFNKIINVTKLQSVWLVFKYVRFESTSDSLNQAWRLTAQTICKYKGYND